MAYKAIICQFGPGTGLKILMYYVCMLRFSSKLSAIITPNGPRSKSYCIKAFLMRLTMLSSYNFVCIEQGIE